MKIPACLLFLTIILASCNPPSEKSSNDSNVIAAGNNAIDSSTQPAIKKTAPAALNIIKNKRSIYVNHINDHFTEQLTNPQKKNRKSLSQFGYNLELFPFPLFPITEFIDPDNFGKQSYGKPGAGEHNGSLYTCHGGFMDFSHIRCAADWTVFLTFKIITDYKDFDLPDEAGTLKLQFQHLDDLSLDDISSMAVKITFERLVWHEVASWHYHSPNYAVSEQQSTFTPEDLYSNLLGASIGKNIAMRILKNLDTLSYSEIATQEIEKTIASLGPVKSKKQSKEAYDIVDRYKQMKLPATERNNDVWWDSNIVFTDERYVFKRDMNIGPQHSPWLVPKSEQLGCSAHPKAEVLKLPQKTKSGQSFYSYYRFTISPDSILFFAKKSHRELHPPFGPFSTDHFDVVVSQIGKEMEEQLLPGYNKRNDNDPVARYKDIKRVLFQ